MINVRRISTLVFVSVVALLLIAPSSTGQAAPSPDRYPDFEERKRLPYLAVEHEPAAVSPNHTTGIYPIPWSKIVFQSYRHENWEIYKVNSDGTQQQRLTSNAAADIHPRLNRGGTHIVFASNRHGPYQIYKMNVDGSNVTRLTYATTDNVNPVWSPDSTRIAFQAYRDGQAEIYVMNANGSGQTRLTANSAYDGEPVWSPDGSQIAFVSKRTGGYRIWVMQADGSGLTQVSSEPYSENPSWSPDGKRLAYDADRDGDGWQEIVIRNVGGSWSFALQYDLNATAKDTWVGSWSPDGNYIIFTQISFVNYNGYWYWTEALLRAWEARANGQTTTLISQNTEWSPDWQTLDTQTPQVEVGWLPAYSRTPIKVTWSGQDGGGAGIRYYDVQYKQNDSEWSDWFIQTAPNHISEPFSGILEHTYDFRVRATDHAFNVSPWSASDGISTTFYSSELISRVRDNRGIPIVNAGVWLTPTALAMFTDDNIGELTAYIGKVTPVYTATWYKDGYENLTKYIESGDSRNRYVDIVLPPKNNIVGDWEFEVSALESSAWEIDGDTLPTLISETQHTGEYSVMVGQPGSLSNPEDTFIDFYSGWASAVVDSEDTLHVVWRDADGSLKYTSRPRGEDWGTPTVIYGSYDEVTGPVITVDSSDALHIVWTVNRNIKYMTKEKNDVWSAAESLPFDVSVLVSDPPQIAIDSTGQPHVVWNDFSSRERGIKHTYKSLIGEWSPVTWVSQQHYYASVRQPTIGFAPNDRLYVAWIYKNDYRPWQVFYASRSSAGSWVTPPVNISQSTQDVANPHLSVDDAGTVHLVWSDSGGLNYVTKQLEWNEKQLITVPENPQRPKITAFHTGISHIIWTHYDGTETDFYYLQKPEDGMLHAVEHFSKMPGQSILYSVVSTSDGTPYILYRNSNNELRCYEPKQSIQAESSMIKQKITLPYTLTQPTLSFFYQFNDVSGENAETFTASVDDGRETEVFSITDSYGEWNHQWYDLSSWRGREITLTFTTQRATGAFQAWALLDEVSIGSAYFDIWINGDNRDALPEEILTYSIDYGNRGSVDTGALWITDTLPNEVLFIDASIQPIIFNSTLVWDIDTLSPQSGPYEIVVTATLASTATTFSTLTHTLEIAPQIISGTLVIDPEQTELETANNRVEATIFVGKHAYLPIVMKNHNN